MVRELRKRTGKVSVGILGPGDQDRMDKWTALALTDDTVRPCLGLIDHTPRKLVFEDD